MTCVEDIEEANFLNSKSDEDAICKLFDPDITNEETLFLLEEKDDLVSLVLTKNYFNEDSCDYLCGLLNLVRRLLQIHDETVDNWLQTKDDSSSKSIVTFIFDLFVDQFEQLCMVKSVDIEEL